MLGEQLEATLNSLQAAVDSPVENPAPVVGEQLLGSQEKRTANQRVVQNLQVVIRPGNASQRKLEIIEGYCKNISLTGCGAITDFAPRVGDLYEFSVPTQNNHVLHGVHARCVRCHLLDEEAFECGFSFLAPVGGTESSVQQSAPNNDLLA